MELKEYKPSVLLSAYVMAYRIIESREGIVNRVLPGTSMAIAFSPGGKISYLNDGKASPLPTTVLSGLRKSVRLINYARGTSALVVLFKPGGLAAFIRQPLHELFEESIALDNFFTASEVSAVEENLFEAQNDKTRVNIVDQFLVSKLIHHPADKLIHEAIARIHRSNGMIRMKELADSLPISRDAFEKRFRKITGSTAKQFSTIVRMKGIIQNPSRKSFLDLALDNGYYDQAHFNKDFKIHTGLTPSDFFTSASFW